MRNLLLVTALLGLSSCATIVSDSDYPVSIQSVPSNTEFMIKDEEQNIVHSGRTPNVTTLKAGDGYFSKAHYTVEYVNHDKKVQENIKTELDNWYWGNILFGGLIGMLIVDPITGAMYELPDRVVADVHTLYPNGVQTQNAPAASTMPFNQNINVTVNVNDGKKETKAEEKKSEKTEKTEELKEEKKEETKVSEKN